MEIRKVSVQDMMDAREARAYAQKFLLEKNPGASLISLTLNIAGPEKNSPLIYRFFRWAVNSVKGLIPRGKSVSFHEISPFTGPEAIWCVMVQPEKMKKLAVMLEDSSPAARLFDIDVIRSDGTKISREEIGVSARKCLLCSENAAICARSRRHPLSEIQHRTQQLIFWHNCDEFEEETAVAAVKSLLDEVAVSPKPGLVDRFDSGAHEDMDIFTFLGSAATLHDYFRKCTHAGITFRDKDASECFDAIRIEGMIAEEKMMEETGGVNTHKGAIFSMGIYCACLGICFDGSGCSPVIALEKAGEMTSSQMKVEMNEMSSNTAGEEIYIRHGIGGIRQEVAAGFPTVRNIGIPCMCRCIDSGMTLNDSAIVTLMCIMKSAADTNLIHRGGIEGMKYAQGTAKKIIDEMKCHKFSQSQLHECMQEMNRSFVKKNLSPGGCADLLAITIMAVEMQKKEGVFGDI